MADDTWTIKAALEWTEGYLGRKGDENPRLSAQWLVSEATGLSRIQLYAQFDKPLSPEERDVLRDYVARRGAGEPLQYISGEAPFRYLTLKVRPGVLIPRPETEVLVSEALACLPPARKREATWNAEAAATEAAAVAEAKERLAEAFAASAPERAEGETNGRPAAVGSSADFASEASAEGGEAAALRTAAGSDASDDPYFLVADVCTGSGCIACAVASERPDTRVIAVDIDAGAVALARENAQMLGLDDKVRVLQGDLLAPVPERYLGRFDLVVSNPPYVPTAVLADIPREVADFEPTLALDGGDDGNDVLRRLLPWCARALKRGGSFAFELHETRLDDAAALAREAGFSDVRIVRDLAGRPRVLLGRKS